jgi:hypothetical protein
MVRNARGLSLRKIAGILDAEKGMLGENSSILPSP